MTTSTLTLLELQAAIIREPLVIPADATVMEAIALMSIGRSQCDAENHSDNHQQQFQQEARSSCVLVLEDEKLIGIVTERDVVRLSAQQQDLDRLLVREVMAHPVVTLRESDLTDLFLAVDLLQQYRIRHLPLLDEQSLLVGMVTHESLRQISRPIDLMRLRLVSEVMTSDVVCAAADRSMLVIAQMMAEQKISSVMIVKPSITDPSLQIPVGIVTERDVVQFQALGLNLETCMAHTVMSTPIFSVKPEDNLLTVQHIMEQRLIRRLAVTSEFGELLGIVTQTSLLQALNPTEIYNLAKVLEAKVEQLESEKVTLLENRNVDLESQVKERTASLLEAEKALQQLNQSLEAKVQERTQEVQLQAQMLEQIHDAVISTALDGTILTWNIGAEILYEYKSDEAIGQNVSMLYLAEDLPLLQSLVFMPLLEKGTHEVEVRIQTKSGSKVYVSLRLSVVWDAMGNPIRLIGCSNNISDRKQAEQIILQQANREILLRGITQRIRQSLDLSIIFDTACQEIQQLLQCDRVGIFKFDSDSNFDDGEFVAESVADGFISVMKVPIHDHCFGEGYAAAHAQGRMQVVNDIDNAGLMDCHRDVLTKFQVRANLVIPLLCGNSLWGLLCIHQCAHTRQWQEHEINLIQQIANQLAIAIQQASLYEQLQEELLIRQQSQLKIAQQLRQQQTLATITNKIRESLSIKEILAVVTQQVKDVLSGDRAIVFQLFDNGNSQIVEESVHNNFPNLKDLNWENEVWSQEILDCYWQGKPRIVPDVMNDIWTECLVEYSIEGQIKSKIIAPILLEPHISENHRWVATEEPKKLWGVLVVHACAEPREWQDSEAQLLQQIANQLAIAIQQASLYEQVQADLSIRKQTEIQLLKVNDELLRATKLKDEFLANMSHELRTPLNSILGLSNALGEQLLGSLNEKQTKAIGTVESSGEHLLSLINDILDLSKISSGMMELNAESVSVKNLCDSSLVFVKQQAFQKQVQLNSNIPKNINNINVEERRIRQVLINLLTNAVKFTPSKGQVNLLIAVGKGDTWQGEATIPQRIKLMNSPMIVFQVVDTGIGIAPNDLQRLFQPFVQVSSSLNRQYEGTGLGLALVKQIVELHGGQVMAESELGKGSSFSVALPYEMSQSSAPESTTVSTTLPPLSIDPDHAPLILLAEDNEANIETFTSYLTAINYRIVVAKNGIEAVAMAKSESPDIIIMDIQMPDMDGLEAIALIRADATIAAIPIIALTALAMEGDRERCLKAGANEYLAKPIKFRQLNTAIQQILTIDLIVP